MGTYCFPLLDVPNLVETFRAWEIDANDSDFRHPKKEVWQNHFISLLAMCLGKEENELASQMNYCQFDDMDGIDYPKLHEEAIPLFTLSRVLSRVLQSGGIEDSNIQDIIDPKPKRLIRICSSLVNFINFRIDRMQAVNRIKEQDNALREQKEILQEEVDKMQKKINTIKATRAEQEPEVLRLVEKIEGMKSQMEEIRKTTAAKQKKTVEKKAKIAETKAQISKVKESIASKREVGVKLASQIVLSPERMKGETERMQAQKQALQVSKEEKLSKLAELRRKHGSMETYSDDLAQAATLIRAVSENVDKEKAMNQQIVKIREQTTLRRDQLKAASTKEQQTRRLLGAKQEKMTKLRLQHDNRMAAMQETLHMLEQDKEMVLGEQTVEEQRQQELVEQQEQLSEMDGHRARQHADNMADMREKYAGMLQQVDVYHKKVGEAWEQCQDQMQLKKQ